ncbi:MAG: hypothetical protein ACLFMZ_09560 [Spirochaetaceae bacterium]
MMAMLFTLLLCNAETLHAQLHLKDPGFPKEESITYIKTSERGRELVETEMKLVSETREGSVDEGAFYSYSLESDANGFDVSLRGFPFEEGEKAEILFLNDSNRFSLELKVKNRETMELDSGTYDCWKVQVGLDGILGRFFPKSYYWYTEPRRPVSSIAATLLFFLFNPSGIG